MREKKQWSWQNLCIALNNKKAPAPKHSQMETKKVGKALKIWLTLLWSSPLESLLRAWAFFEALWICRRGYWVSGNFSAILHWWPVVCSTEVMFTIFIAITFHRSPKNSSRDNSTKYVEHQCRLLKRGTLSPIQVHGLHFTGFENILSVCRLVLSLNGPSI